jgi:ubiquinone/menaquinone biosynthesis C-methylase UbiE
MRGYRAMRRKQAFGMNRGYQVNYSDRVSSMFNEDRRRRKAVTMVAVLREHLADSLETLDLLNVGGSAGIIDNHLADEFRHVISIDIDKKAVQFAQERFRRDNLEFEVGDAMNMPFKEGSFDVVICSQVYEHVPDAGTMMDEIYRVLKPGGVVYFAAGNRLMLNEPHYNLPFLSVVPRSLAHVYVRLAGKSDHYYEKHLTWWGLRGLTGKFRVVDYTSRIVGDPASYGADYMVKPGSRKQAVARFLARYLIWLVPGYIWLLEKPRDLAF